MSNLNVYVLLDRSGSMENLWSEAKGSIDAYVAGLPYDTNVFVAVFDNVFESIRNTKAHSFRPLKSDESIRPRGSTALMDSAMRVIHRMMDDRPEKAVFVVMTDGEENSSSKYAKSELITALDAIKAKGYEVIFLGANFNKIGEVAKTFNIAQNKFADIKPGDFHDYALGLSAATRSYASSATAINANEINAGQIGQNNPVKSSNDLTLARAS